MSRFALTGTKNDFAAVALVSKGIARFGGAIGGHAGASRASFGDS
jgi:hypothetical protein